MRTAWSVTLLALASLCCGCATGMAREGRCLATLTPEFLEAQVEVARLEAAWRALSADLPDYHPSILDVSSPTRREWEQRRGEARARLQEARLHHQQTLQWFDRLYQRVRARMEEEQLLSEVFWSLAPTPGLIFYPVVRWNLHSVMWDGADPDAETDDIRRFCTALAIKGPQPSMP